MRHKVKKIGKQGPLTYVFAFPGWTPTRAEIYDPNGSLVAVQEISPILAVISIPSIDHRILFTSTSGGTAAFQGPG